MGDGGAGAEVVFPWMCLHQFDELAEGVCLKRRVDDHEGGLLDEHADRCEVPHDIEWRLFRHRGGNYRRRVEEHYRVTVIARLRADLRADDPLRAAAVIDEHVLAQRFGQGRRYYASDKVG